MLLLFVLLFFFFVKQKTAYELRISDWSSDVCSSDLRVTVRLVDSPACVVVEANELSPHLLRMLQAAGQEAPEVKPILEINPEHALIGREIGRASCRERVCQYV